MIGRIWILGSILAAAMVCACAPLQRAGERDACGDDASSWTSLTQADYKFAESAQTSVRSAFLGFLAEDAVVLHPDPQPGVPVWLAAKESRDRLAWYPTAAEVAAGSGFGFTTGPWVYSDAGGGTPIHGHFVTVWKRDRQCRWRVVFDGGVTNPAPEVLERKLHDDSRPRAMPARPRDAAAGAASVDAFDTDADRDGLAAAVQRAARDDVRLYVNGYMPIVGRSAAGEFLSVHPYSGTWIEAARLQSERGDFLYAFGEIGDGTGARSAAYLQIWRCDSRAADWRLRLLLVSTYAHPRAKS